MHYIDQANTIVQPTVPAWQPKVVDVQPPQPQSRISNTRAVLQATAKHGPLTRWELMQETGLKEKQLIGVIERCKKSASTTVEIDRSAGHGRTTYALRRAKPVCPHCGRA